MSRYDYLLAMITEARFLEDPFRHIEIDDFFSQQDFVRLIEAPEIKFDESADDMQKYLSGYEISPHPDVRAKALTYMINVDPDPDCERQEYRTHYMRFTPGRSHVEAYWRGNPQHDRCWVPWSWCETVKRQVRNNSIVIFAPSDDTLHGVKANYDHLPAQRTQFYGNLWYNRIEKTGKPTWRDFEIQPTPDRRVRTTLRQSIVDHLPMKRNIRRVKQAIMGRWIGCGKRRQEWLKLWN